MQSEYNSLAKHLTCLVYPGYLHPLQASELEIPGLYWMKITFDYEKTILEKLPIFIKLQMTL